MLLLYILNTWLKWTQFYHITHLVIFCMFIWSVICDRLYIIYSSCKFIFYPRNVTANNVNLDICISVLNKNKNLDSPSKYGIEISYYYYFVHKNIFWNCIFIWVYALVFDFSTVAYWHRLFILFAMNNQILKSLNSMLVSKEIIEKIPTSGTITFCISINVLLFHINEYVYGKLKMKFNIMPYNEYISLLI